MLKTDAYWKGNKFIGVPTEGAKVVNGVLEYPVKNNKALKLKFTAKSQGAMPHSAAAEHCKQQGLRLPTVRELFDFCVVGTAPNGEGRFDNNRCGENWIWAASVYSDNRYYAWRFNGDNGLAGLFDRNPSYGVRCVGGP
jgi:hypothetical protein